MAEFKSKSAFIYQYFSSQETLLTISSAFEL